MADSFKAIVSVYVHRNNVAEVQYDDGTLQMVGARQVSVDSRISDKVYEWIKTNPVKVQALAALLVGTAGNELVRAILAILL